MFKAASPQLSLLFASLCCLSASACRRDTSPLCPKDDPACADADAGEPTDGDDAAGSARAGNGSKTLGATKGATAGVGGAAARSSVSKAGAVIAGAPSKAEAGGSSADPRADENSEQAGAPETGGAGGAGAARAQAKNTGGSSGAAGAQAEGKRAGAGGKPAEPETTPEMMPMTMMPMTMKPGAGGAEAPEAECKDAACKAARLAACDSQCGECEACSPQMLTCQPVSGRDDIDSCADDHTCSRTAKCLRRSVSQPELGDAPEEVALTAKYAQVIEFPKPAHVEEIRLELSCAQSVDSFPAVSISLMQNGQPSTTPFAHAIVTRQEPAQGHNYVVLELSKTFDEPETGPFALVVSETDSDCNIRINRALAYEFGSLLTQRTAGVWTPAEGSMVFEVLSSK